MTLAALHVIDIMVKQNGLARSSPLLIRVDLFTVQMMCLKQQSVIKF
ncbi:Uncharacterised protein [Mycobacterium tuberculosis]|nr:Uncharacterised protein [Mycobacterium tuberculosis]